MSKICTNILQSKKFIELGIDINTADMHYMYRRWEIDENTVGSQSDASIGFDSDFYYGADNGETYHYIPAWSLSALLGLMPKSICIKQSEHSGYFYFLEWQFANDNSLRYVGHDGKCLIDIYSDHDVKWKDSIDTAFEMICWLKENNKL